VSGVAGQCSETTSLSASSASSVGRRSASSAAAASSRADGFRYSTRIPKPWRARRATACPMRPKPTMPNVRPDSDVPSSCDGRQPSQPPARSSRSPSPSRRAAMSTSAIATSAVSSVSTPGVLVTATPCARAAARSMWLTPTPKFASRRCAASRPRRLLEHRGREAVGHGAEHRVGRGQRVRQPIGVEGDVLGVEPGVEERGEARLDGRGHLAGHDDEWAHGREGYGPRRLGGSG
jgi:hypothetical protein